MSLLVGRGLQDDSAPEKLGEMSCMSKGEQNDLGMFCRGRGILEVGFQNNQYSAPEELGEMSCMPKGERNDMGVFCKGRGISRGEGDLQWRWCGRGTSRDGERI